MTNEEMLDLLNGDLANERMHRDFYLYASSAVEGLHRSELREFFWKQAQSEMGHIRAFQDVIWGMGGVPDADASLHHLDPYDPHSLLQFAMEMEEEVVKNYNKRLQQAEELPTDTPDGRFLTIFLEEQMLDSRTDLDNIRKMLQYTTPHQEV